ncbi:putative metal-dependent hydrolase YcfH [Candidatus Rhabdochlamydia oedothoracis]|uniref:Metal-dependent hydrolase YcfH n=1 Tax=Candidatus Rhabdochlamydia oedothoracis TaxID=2720720 RepID=A0ABX8UYV8_9BACT|nr:MULTISPECIES: TatD family hydrolase [Rhabdochlamydia]KAG6558842.1 putative metal-dependent hydrolase YcfH [Candidatus Rhabdochlamydia sp. W815]MCL6756191.1 TatD family hydrolase [Candidatus Rhabdochlamydia oedothoracis]QYF48153.1 putative metal-dependent hydrolase YcfH [Candidatus Rhabdochlamydia oedothoracis]
MFIDTHAHLTSDTLVNDTQQILARAQTNQIDKIVNICTDERSLKAGLLLREKTSWVFNAAATTPHDVEKEGESFFTLVKQAAYHKQLIAIGETGLDYHYQYSPKEMQKRYLELCLDLRRKVDLPIIFHCRDAFADLFTIAGKVPAVLHCFTGSLEEAKKALELGWYLSISGIVTFKKSQALQEIVKYVPLEHVFIETDAPYLAPVPYRGKVNEPGFLTETAKMIAHLKQTSIEEVARKTKQNAEIFFRF